MTVAARLLIGAALIATSCLPDETLELHPSTGSSGGGQAGAAQGGGGAGGGGAAGGGGGCAHHVDCTSAAPYCDMGACSECPDGLVLCGGSCVDLQRDAGHCGGCFEPCHIAEACQDAVCECMPGFERCGTACVDTASDPDHCGGCDHPCASGERCEQSGCHVGHVCEGGLMPCDATDDRVACTDPHLAPRCGGCELACGPSETCVETTCRAFVPATPCDACPCASCEAQAATSACCNQLPGQAGASCVQGEHCP